jgi:beta-lactam-binding protein with PASTA domain
MTRRGAGVLVLVALVLAGCGERDSSQGAGVIVPDVVGKPRSQAICALADAGLRWRISPDRHVRSRPPAGCDDAGSAGEPDPRVLRQRPAPGSRVDRDAVVVLHDQCERRSCA